MERILRLATCIGVLALAQASDAADPPKDGGKNGDATKLLGKWQAVSGEYAGKPLTAGQCERFGLEIDENHFTIMSGGKPLRRNTYKLDSSAKPKSVALWTVDTRVLYEKAAIYELDGDKLKISIRFGNKPPADFTTKNDGSSTSVYVLKRQ